MRLGPNLQTNFEIISAYELDTNTILSAYEEELISWKCENKLIFPLFFSMKWFIYLLGEGEK